MKNNSYIYWIKKGLAKSGTFYCQCCSELIKGRAYRTSKKVDEDKITLKVCEICFMLSKLKIVDKDSPVVYT